MALTDGAVGAIVVILCVCASESQRVFAPSRFRAFGAFVHRVCSRAFGARGPRIRGFAAKTAIFVE
jgi:hypothetical protein